MNVLIFLSNSISILINIVLLFRKLFYQINVYPYLSTFNNYFIQFSTNVSFNFQQQLDSIFNNYFIQFSTTISIKFKLTLVLMNAKLVTLISSSSSHTCCLETNCISWAPSLYSTLKCSNTTKPLAYPTLINADLIIE